MKALIYCRPDNTDWVKSFFPDESPYKLRIANKPLLEYYVDFCALIGIKQIRVVTVDDNGSISNFLGGGEILGVDISYNLSRKEDSLAKVFLKNMGFCSSSDLLVIDGFGFINYDKEKVDYSDFINASTGYLQEGDFRIYSLNSRDTEGRVDLESLEEFLDSTLSISRIDGIQDYFALSRSIIRERAANFVLPGYSSERDVFIGQNVALAKSSRIDKPVMIGNNVQLRNSCSIGAETIIGDNIIIDSDATVSSSIIYGNSYIGPGVELVNKIVYKNYLISPDTGDRIEIVDSFLTSKIAEKARTAAIRKAAHYFITVFLIIVYCVPYSVFWPFVNASRANFKRKSFIISKNLRTVRVNVVNRSNFILNLFVKLSLDKFPLLIEAFKGNLHLTGNTLYEDTDKTRNFIETLQFYRPGIFSYSESISPNQDIDQDMLNDSFYCYHRTPLMDIQVLFGAIFNRFFYNNQ
ncbi:UDP-3-O-[3-hydroxymyristoyl] glucosamine N-acyltransferase [Sedimentisphaera cyanobacteriorum]|uniref:UDP-3-O-[3-hydroxymyristoyl] glucosamine N-acyltransferase n=1 Tax=Sedimentisphaera cyanobacteriorum TaxID=1940790 RepID=A0A1Q2HNX7_9BACT|nr:NDP-sugar synthase [Sedimentisphaera cyanobacteriorum]AQQ08946.1 UDP-3-O-[3-hydroxymyristoyl] glucosamine N-acyltransferase [Sedimentisphaera cyanobacteriorum]